MGGRRKKNTNFLRVEHVNSLKTVAYTSNYKSMCTCLEWQLYYTWGKLVKFERLWTFHTEFEPSRHRRCALPIELFVFARGSEIYSKKKIANYWFHSLYLWNCGLFRNICHNHWQIINVVRIPKYLQIAE